ncbi:MAG: type IV secretion system protein [Fusobacterium sp.]|nr:type IV secretion system protein [Fusobacterium sp.]
MFGVDVQMIFNTVVDYAGNMINNLQPTVLSMFFTLMSIDLVLSFLFDESDGLNVFIKLVKKFFYYGFFLYIIKEYKDLIFNKLFAGFVQLGNLASTGSTSTSLDWEVMNKLGVDIGDMAGGILGALGFAALDYTGLESAAIIGLGAVAAYIMFFLMLYVQVVTIFIKFYFMAGFAYILMPFSAFEKTKDITSKALNGLFTQAVEIYIMVILLNFLDKLDNFSWFHPTGGIKDTIWTRWVLILFMYMLLTKTGSIASGLMSGALATLGIGASAMAGAGSRVTGAGGNIVGKDMSKASEYNAMQKGTGGKESAGFAYKQASNFIGKFKK